MSLSTPLRPVSAPARGTHEHTRSCWWDHLACRWAGPAHPAAESPVVPVPAPRTSLDG